VQEEPAMSFSTRRHPVIMHAAMPELFISIGGISSAAPTSFRLPNARKLPTAREQTVIMSDLQPGAAAHDSGVSASGCDDRD